MMSDGNADPFEEVDSLIERLVAARDVARAGAHGVADAAVGRPLTVWEGSLLDGYLDDWDRAELRLRRLQRGRDAWADLIANHGFDPQLVDADLDVNEALRVLRRWSLGLDLDREDRTFLVWFIRSCLAPFDQDLVDRYIIAGRR